MREKLWKLVVVGVLLICAITAYGAAQMTTPQVGGGIEETTPVTGQGNGEEAQQFTDLNGFWVGWFQCGDKNFSFEMNITEITSDGELHGVFTFEGPENSGSHFISGLNNDDGDFIFGYGDWIREGTYRMTGSGSMSEDGRSINGSIGGDCDSNPRTLYARRYLGDHVMVGNKLDRYLTVSYIGEDENSYVIILDKNFFGDGVMTSFSARFVNLNPLTVMVVRPETDSLSSFKVIHSYIFQPKNLTKYGSIQTLHFLSDCPPVQQGDRLAFTNINRDEGGGPVAYVGDTNYMFTWLRYEYQPTEPVPEVGDKLSVTRMIHAKKFFAMATYAPEILCGENVEPYVATTTKRPTTTTTTTTTTQAETTTTPAADITTTLPPVTTTVTETTTTEATVAETTTTEGDQTTSTTTTQNPPVTTPGNPTTPVIPSLAPDPGPDGGDGQCTVISNLNVKCESAVSNPNGGSSDVPWDAPPRDCTEVLAKGATESGPYFIRPHFGPSVDPETLQVYCHFEDGKAWTTVLRRLDGAIDFSECKLDGGCHEEGTGHYSYEYWIGLKKLHTITQDKAYKLRVSMETFSGSSVFAEYSVFWLNNYANYRLHIGGHSGIAGDSLGLHNTFRFTSACRDIAGQVGWIEKSDGSCETHANLFGPYSSECGENNECIYWDTIPADPDGRNRAIKILELKITPN